MRCFIELAYNGTHFFGWQHQPKHITVQKVIEFAFSMLLKKKIELTGCGRTDAGVHAKQYFAHFDHDVLFSDIFCEKLIQRLNSFLPKEIVIYNIFSVSEDLHARFSAIERTYKYYVTTAKNPFQLQFSHQVNGKLDIEAMNFAASLLLGNKDFTSFSKLHTDVNNNFCEVKAAYWEMQNELLVFTITANRFLRNMVRAIVGTLLWVGNGKISIAEFENIIAQQDRCKAGMSVPANALFLEEVKYNGF
jgi:tRNA pseudouridine38-40 synthase